MTVTQKKRRFTKEPRDNDAQLQEQEGATSQGPSALHHPPFAPFPPRHSLAPSSHTADDDFGQKYHCDACRKDLTHVVRIRCAVCSEFDLCVECFSTGAEPNAVHKKDHAYRVMEILDFPIFEEDWGADEEMLLVEGLEMFGIGNWEQIAEHIGTKNKLECAEHYDRVFVNSEDWPMPVCEGEESGRPRIVPKKLPRVAKPTSSAPTNHEISGYMPGRAEFETEHENEAEQYVKDMEFGDNEPPEDVELKTTILNIYNSTLDRRSERKKLIFERGLTDFRKVSRVDARRAKEEKDIITKMRVFAKVQTAQDAELMNEGLLNELKIRQRIAQLQECRRMGVTKLSDIQEYEQDKANRTSTPTSRATTPAKSFAPLPTPLVPATHPPRAATPAASLPGARKPPNQLDITTADGVDLLSSGEQTLCSNLRLYPRAYLVIKETLLKEYAAKGLLRRRQARELIKIDVNKTSKIYDYFVEMGWVSAVARPVLK
ncbi:hypothetical protein BDK51DRAFT_20270 [Blyttiomyces helicus]|uniref:Transcriptional adapter 2 n=1 Tax=Blyttiomyces helicus TaxID=388810 RepID=A0A4P9WNJ3_9FUNG|nr:hypothetical protein BDK51DRAFT_20270 [Blyttiomyces helicus]|eukprot:RKO92336.1 hypothetical protein BDK51DRAFT_20270 [Blyttiomyces helicus]